jgi:hypothetical protein
VKNHRDLCFSEQSKFYDIAAGREGFVGPRSHVSSEPVVVQLSQELWREWIAGMRTDDCIDAAPRTKTRHVFSLIQIYPLLDLRRCKGLTAVEATTQLADQYLLPMIGRVSVCRLKVCFVTFGTTHRARSGLTRIRPQFAASCDTWLDSRNLVTISFLNYEIWQSVGLECERLEQCNMMKRCPGSIACPR